MGGGTGFLSAWETADFAWKTLPYQESGTPAGRAACVAA